MKEFVYEGIDKNGDNVSGRVKAKDLNEAIDQITFKNIAINSIVEPPDDELTFGYKALDSEGKEVKGVIKATCSDDALQKLRGKNLLSAKLTMDDLTFDRMLTGVEGYPEEFVYTRKKVGQMATVAFFGGLLIGIIVGMLIGGLLF